MTMPDLTTLDEATLLQVALSGRQDFGQAPYIDELARRALENPSLLGAACQAITLGRKVGFHKMASGWVAGGRILDSGNDAATRQLLLAMDAWAPHEQEDFLQAWAGNRKVAAAARSLSERYGWTPKF